MKEILNLLPVLCIAILMNISAGMYYNIGTKNIKFNWYTLFSGIIKSGIIAGMFLGTAYCFEATDLSSITSSLGITPNLMMTAAITMYVTKALISLSKILGLKTINKS